MDNGAVQVVFYDVDQPMEVKREVMPLVRANSSKRAGTDAYAAFSGRDVNDKRIVQVQLLHAASAWTLLHGHAHVWRCTDGSAAVANAHFCLLVVISVGRLSSDYDVSS